MKWRPDMIYDISLPLSDRLAVWPGDPPISLTRVGDPAGPWVSQLSLGSHAGTHVDAPAHFIIGGATIDRLPLEVLIGPAWVAHLPSPGPLRAADLAAAGIPAGVTRLLLRTRNSDDTAVGCPPVGADGYPPVGADGYPPVGVDGYPPVGVFNPHFVALAPDAAAWLLARGIGLVGIDAPSIEPYDSPGEPVHRTLLGAGVVILEGLALVGIVPGAYQLVCLPLRLAGADGAPARAVLIEA